MLNTTISVEQSLVTVIRFRHNPTPACEGGGKCCDFFSIHDRDKHKLLPIHDTDRYTPLPIHDTDRYKPLPIHDRDRHKLLHIHVTEKYEHLPKVSDIYKKNISIQKGFKGL